jgi:hypothetical protein
LKYFGITILIFLWGCAQISPLQGGPKDVYAPAIDSAKSIPLSGQINFDQQEVKLRFNEYIQLNNPKENIIFSPQQVIAPTVSSKNKKLNILFNDELEANTTYTITFNGAIQDITEKNDSVFQYVFSTGDYIDSLQIKGKVIDAFTNRPLDGMLVGLYPVDVPSNFDSIPFNIKPTYLGQSDNSGDFELNYLKNGIYYIFAIEDMNKNLLYDQGEKIALLSEKTINLEENISNIKLRMFQELNDECFVEDVSFSYPGKLTVVLSNPTDSFNVASNLNLLQEDTESRDSLVYWLEQNPVPKMRFYIDLKGELDTIKPIFKNVPDDNKTIPLTMENNVMQGKLLPSENLLLTFSEPVGEVSPGAIKFYDIDSNEVQMEAPTKKVRGLEFNSFGTKASRVEIDSAAVTSVYGHRSEKQQTILFDSHGVDYYGSLIINVDTFFNQKVLVHLMNNKEQLIDSMSFSQKMTFSNIIPGDYQLRLIFDVDNNEEWTTGVLKEAKLPEEVIYYVEPIKIKSKWEKEIDWIFISD